MPRRNQRAVSRRLPRYAAGLTLSLVVTFSTIEIMLHVLRDRVPLLRALLYSPEEPVTYDGIGDVRTLIAVTPFHPRPFQQWGDFKLNSLGFRTAEYQPVKPPGTYRVLALGDSFTFDSGFVPVERMWHSVVGQRVRERTRRPVEVLNLGIPGVGPRFALRMFQLEGRRLAPDLVLLGLFVGNDLFDEVGAPSPRSGPGRFSLTWRLADHLAVLVRSAAPVLQRLPHDEGPGGHPVRGPVYDPEVALGSDETLVRVERNDARVFARHSRTEAETRLADVAGTVAALDRAVREARGTLVVVVIPDRVQVDDDLRRAVLGASRPEDYDFDWLQTALTGRLAAAGVRSIDLLPAFRAAAPTPPRLYRRADTHWSAAGNRLAADEIAGFLARNPPR